MTLTKKELADIAGYTYRRLHEIDTKLPEEKKLFVKGEDGKYDLALFVKRWVDYNVSRMMNEGDLSLEEAKTIHEKVKTQKTELEVEKMRGELVSIGEVRMLWANIASTVMQNMIRLPSKIAPQIVMMENVEVISGIIDKEVRDVLCAIADTPIPGNGPKMEETGDEEDEPEE